MIDVVNSAILVMNAFINLLRPLLDAIPVLNSFFDQALPWVCGATLLYINIRMLINWIQNNLKQKKGKQGIKDPFFWISAHGRSFFLFGISITAQVIIAILFFSLPYFFPKIKETIYWIEIYIAGCGAIYFLTRQKSGHRGLYTSVCHITVLCLGWSYGKWLGIFFISGISFALFYYWLYHLALVIVPVSNPENTKESFQRFKMLAWYLWGFQFPVWVINNQTDRITEERISGDVFKSFGLPGMIWVQSHQAVGITSGTQFSRVEGPGVIYTRPYERPHEVVDLRPQIRTSLVDAISQDGIPYQARILVVFSIDKTTWQEAEYSIYRTKNKLLRGAKKPDRSAGNYQYSRGRVTAALSIKSVKRSITEEQNRPILYWDHWVLAMVEEAARKELSRHSLNELWRPSRDEQNMNPLDALAINIKNNTSDQIKINGISLIAARIVDLKFDSEDAKEVLNQQIDNWESYMEQDISHTKSNAEAKLVKIKEDAAAYARSNLLTTIAKGLEQIGDTHENLPKKYVVAVRLIAALENSLRDQPENKNGDKKLEDVRSIIREFTPEQDRRQKQHGSGTR